MWVFKMMSGFKNPGDFLLILTYFFIFQATLTLFGWQLKEKREKILNWNIVIGSLPFVLSIELLFDHYQNSFFGELTLILTYFCICFALNTFFWIFSFLFKLILLKIRWYFFSYINVIGGWIFSILI
ncbi:hypothetical protein SAMN05216500_1142 [Acinetobacter sp. DSM 11652]|nr:hypothetical protein SAMN05216500_1142 [Acinetobacter sp. DSM 11652]